MQWESRATVKVTCHDRVFEISVRGEVDYEENDLLQAAWAEVEEAALPVTVVDLSQVTFADSGLLNALLDSRRRHRAAGRELILLGPFHPTVQRLFTLTGTLEHFTVTDSRARAMRADET
ncbi:STAS domain-containing protein [Streptomyces naphthomycinicus]|uniref:STAS domain-containing protein n=1 Tax=Streptomyces naphthomycinicus TaxID=2872625 RepID=UPI001CED68D4|nr:STAS domain-containing protein [Streptomyces sp. TML10]